MAKIKPLGDKILVEILEAEEKTKGGIFLPDTAKEEKTEGKVVAVGAGKVLDSEKFSRWKLKKATKSFSENIPETISRLTARSTRSSKNQKF